MTRLNLVPPEELFDQHLFAEFREIKMIAPALARSLKASPDIESVLRRIPPKFTLGRGHVMFFYDKYHYLQARYEDLKAELRKRSVNFNERSQLDPLHDFEALSVLRNYVPTPEALALVRARIAEKVALRPQWYRYYGTLAATSGIATKLEFLKS